MPSPLFTFLAGRGCHVPGGPSVHGRLEKLTVSISPKMLEEVESIVKGSGYWLSAVDFIREATAEKIERWKAEHSTQSK